MAAGTVMLHRGTKTTGSWMLDIKKSAWLGIKASWNMGENNPKYLWVQRRVALTAAMGSASWERLQLCRTTHSPGAFWSRSSTRQVRAIAFSARVMLSAMFYYLLLWLNVAQSGGAPGFLPAEMGRKGFWFFH